MHKFSSTFLFLLVIAGPLRAADTGIPASAQSTATPLAPIQVEAVGTHSDADLGSIDGAPLHNSPVSVGVIDRRQLDNLQPQSLSEVMRADASVGDNYAPVGYYQNLAIRGFALDLATGYRINGLAMVGQQRLALEDKQRVEVLKGLAGIEAGVVAPGGLVNFVSKRPAEVRRLSLGTDSHGSRRTAIDFGTWLTPDLGIRVNGAWNGVHSHVDHADGRRNLYALALDWNPGDTISLRIDSDYQTSAQRSVSGYQLLGGTELPDNPHANWMPGYQPWQQPVGIRSSNTTARLDWQFAERWTLKLAGGHSRSVIQDNVAFAYGCFYVEACYDGGYPGNFFAPDGSYDIYDYRSPDDTRRSDEARAILVGSFDTGPVRHTLSAGLDAVRRTVDQRPDVNEYVGTANIDQRDPPVFAPSPLEPGPLARRLSNWQRSLLAQDRLQFGDHWQLSLGTRFVRLDERAHDNAGTPERHTRLAQSLPQAALVWLPNDSLTGYLSYSEGLSLGQEAPFWTSNDGAILPPLHSRQSEVGVKWRSNRKLALSAAAFRIRRPLQYAQPDDSAAGYTFVQQGEQVHEGFELGAHGTLTGNLRIDASLAWIRARARNSGTPAYEGHQLVNVPRLQSAVMADYQFAALPGLSLLAGWRHSGPRVATADGASRADGRDLFDAGARYRSNWRGHAVTWHLMISNLTNRFHWRDTGGAYGDHYLFPGAPREARLMVDWSF